MAWDSIKIDLQDIVYATDYNNVVAAIKSASYPPAHNNTTDKQGGTSNQYYHLSETSYASVITWNIDPSGYAAISGYATIAGYATTSGYATICGVASDSELFDGLDSATFMLQDGSRAFTDYIDIEELADPATTPEAGTLRLYAEEIKGFPFFSFIDETGMVRKLVRDSVFVGKAAENISVGHAVYAYGSSGNVPTLKHANASSLTTMPAIGVAIEDITSGSFGRVMQVGLLENFDTSLFAEGDVLFVSATTAGHLVNTAPLYPNIRQEIGTVLVSSEDSGAMQIIAKSMVNEGIISHAGLVDLQGGTTSQYYHSTLSEYTGTGTGVFVRQYSPQIKAGLGINTDPSYLLHIKGTSTTDLPTYSSEFLDATNWTSVGWTGSFATGWKHTTGNTTILSHDHAAVNSTKYQITYTVSGRTDGTFTITFGGQSKTSLSASGAWGSTTTSTGVLQITPTSTFNGTIIISIKSIPVGTTPGIVLTNSSGVNVGHIRIGNSNKNTMMGLDAGACITTGDENTAIGFYSLLYNTTGNYNTAVGYCALRYNTTSNSNSAFGQNALITNTIGYSNTAVGNNSLASNTEGYYNAGVGVNSLYNQTTGYQNTGIGYQSGRSITIGYNNSFVGSNSGYNDNQKVDAINSVGLGYNTFTTRSNQIVIGDENIVETHLRTGVYIGSTSTTAHTQPTARLHIAPGSAIASTAPIKLTSGVLMTATEDGALEYDGANLYFSVGATRMTVTLT